MRHRRHSDLQQPSLVPMADMLTNTVGIMLFVLILASLSAGAAVTFKRLPIERPTRKVPAVLFCSGGRMVHIDPAALQGQIEEGLPQPTFSTADEWARQYSARTAQTGDALVSGQASAEHSSGFFQQSVSIAKSIAVRRKADRGDDEQAVVSGKSAFHLLLSRSDRQRSFFFFVVDPDCIHLFRAARDRAVAAGFDTGWTPVGAGEPARFGPGGRAMDVN
jgi:hypothetical protein